MKGIEERGKRSYRIYYTDRHGKIHRETIKGETQEAAYEEAVRQLAIRQGDLAKGVPVTSKPHTVLFRELCADVVCDYQYRKLRSVADIEARFRLHLCPFFGDKRAAEITTADFKRYIVERQREGAADGAICRELEAARRAYLLARDGTSPAKVLMVPKIPMPKNSTPRQGFFERAQIEALCRHLPAHLHAPLWFAFITGWRREEVLTRRWRHVSDACVRLEPGETKNGKGREFPLEVDELRALLESIRPQGRAFPNQLLFPTPEGAQIKQFSKTWARACQKVGLPVVYVPVMEVAGRDAEGEPLRDEKGQIVLKPKLIKRGSRKGQPVQPQLRAKVYFHDFRRTAYRNLLRMGVIQSVAQHAVGWLDADTAARYDVTDASDLKSLAERYNAMNPAPAPQQQTK